jgi:hypothetical protein
MFKHTLAAILILGALVAAAMPVHAAGKPTGTEFKDGWNTFGTAKEGDWVEYQVGDNMVRRIEVKKVSGDKLTTVTSIINAGKTSEPKEITKEWWLQYFPSKVPPNMEVTWSTEEIKVGDVTLKCDVASWTNMSMSNELYFCKDVRCGGYIKHLMNGSTSVWLKNYGDASKKEGYLKQVADPNAGQGPTLPSFYTQSGNKAVFKTKDASGEKFTLREIEDFDGTTCTYTDIGCDKDGKSPEGEKVVEHKLTGEQWGKLYPKASATGEKVKVTAGELTCSLYESTDGARTKKEWLTPEGLIAKSEIKDGDKLTTTELISMKFK